MLARLTFSLENSLDLLARIFGVKIIKNGSNAKVKATKNR